MVQYPNATLAAAMIVSQAFSACGEPLWTSTATGQAVAAVTAAINTCDHASFPISPSALAIALKNTTALVNTTGTASQTSREDGIPAQAARRSRPAIMTQTVASKPHMLMTPTVRRNSRRDVASSELTPCTNAVRPLAVA